MILTVDEWRLYRCIDDVAAGSKSMCVCVYTITCWIQYDGNSEETCTRFDRRVDNDVDGIRVLRNFLNSTRGRIQFCLLLLWSRAFRKRFLAIWRDDDGFDFIIFSFVCLLVDSSSSSSNLMVIMLLLFISINSVFFSFLFSFFYLFFLQ